MTSWLIVICFLSTCLPIPTVQAQTKPKSPQYIPLRYLAINVGNLRALDEYALKLSEENVVGRIKKYITDWQPDVILLSEIYDSRQLNQDIFYTNRVLGFPVKENIGNLLPAGYTGRCGESRFRNGTLADPPNQPGASHEHECVAWKTSRLTYVAGSARSERGADSAALGFDPDKCEYDFTGFRVKLKLKGVKEPITAVSMHPKSGMPVSAPLYDANDNAASACRKDTIKRIWQNLVGSNPNVIIGGDWNTDLPAELQVPFRSASNPKGFINNLSFGKYWDGTFANGRHHTASYVFKPVHYDHAFSNFGRPATKLATDFPQYYPGGSDRNLKFGAAVGGYGTGTLGLSDIHPRADGGEGCDHRQLLIDMKIPKVDLAFAIDTTGSMGDDLARVKADITEKILPKLAGITPDYRVAVTNFKDHPSYPYGSWGDYPYRANLAFSTDDDAIKGAINSLYASGGADWPESVHSGLMGAIRGDGIGAWRENTKKVVILMGDAPPHDPEPFTGYTTDSVAEAARPENITFALEEEEDSGDAAAHTTMHRMSKNGVETAFARAGATRLAHGAMRKIGYTPDKLSIKSAAPGAQDSATTVSRYQEEGVIVYPIVIGNGYYGTDPDTTRTFTEIAEKTGGKVFTAEDADAVVDAILNILEEVGGDPDPEPTEGADLSLTVSAAPPAALTGSDLTYSFTATNTGAVNAEAVVVTATLPAGVVLRSAAVPAGWTCSAPNAAGNVTCTAAALAAGELAVLNLTAAIDCALPDGASLGATASISSSTVDPVATNNVASTIATASNPSPLISAVSTSLTELWPANHQMIDITLDYSVTDNCGTLTNTVSVTSNEPVNGTGDGNTAPDWEIIDGNRIRLRAERAGNGIGRVYTIVVTSHDSAGNSSSRSATVQVLKSAGQHP
jgi:uncharacterized repeat protein (TIGR01451 family)